MGSGRCALGATLVSTFFNDAYRGRRVLVTGHTGFKGSWLALWLHALGARVAGFSLDVPTRPSNFEALNVTALLISAGEKQVSAWPPVSSARMMPLSRGSSAMFGLPVECML